MRFMPQVSGQVYTVSAVNRMAKTVLEESFPSIWVEGEISNYHHHGSGHRYFSLKDDQCQLAGVMWRSHAEALKFQPEDGLKVLARGSLTIYDRGGRYQFSISRMLPAGMGELELAFQQLKEKLEKEGLFDADHKKDLPAYPMKIGVVTSPTGAVIHDIIRIVKSRNRKQSIIIQPSEVQGEAAPVQLAEGIEQLNDYGEVDLIIIGRGGGSLEDIWAFNDERVVRAIYDSSLPVISAVGHEVDITLSDLAADFSAATPSMAAEIVSWPLDQFLARLGDYLKSMHRVARANYINGKNRLHNLLRRPELARPATMLESRYQYLDSRVRLLHLLSERRFDTFQRSAALCASRLEALSPLAVLARGYSVCRILPGEKVLSSISGTSAGKKLETVVTDGRIVSIVEDVFPDAVDQKKKKI